MRTHAPRLVLVDVNLPTLDGRASAQAIARIRPDAVIVLMSASPDFELAGEPLADGAAAFLHKEHFVPRKLREPRDVDSTEVAG